MNENAVSYFENNFLLCSNSLLEITFSITGCLDTFSSNKVITANHKRWSLYRFIQGREVGMILIF